MRLADWLKSFDGGVKGFADQIGVHFTNVYRYVAGERMPRPPVMQRITVATGGAVTPADFYEMPAPHSAASGLRARSPSRASQVAAGGRGETPAGGAAKRKRNHSHASKKAWRSRKRRAAARAAAEARA